LSIAHDELTLAMAADALVDAAAAVKTS